MLINEKAIRQFCHNREMQISKVALRTINDKVKTLLQKVCFQFNGHKKRIDADLVNLFKV